jgi:hypothetical protein
MLIHDKDAVNSKYAREPVTGDQTWAKKAVLAGPKHADFPCSL